jgi:O-antigen/teichoic acid export membrane protein
MITRLGKNALWLFASRLATQATTVLFTVFVARQLGSASFGVYAFLSAVLFIGNMLTTFGTDMLLMREIAARRALSLLPAAMLLQLGLSLLFILIVGTGAPLFPNQSAISVMAVRIYTLSLIPLAFYTVFTIALRGTENMGLYALLGFASAALQLIGIAFVPAGGILALVIWPFFVQVGDDGLADQLVAAVYAHGGQCAKGATRTTAAPYR